MLNTNVSVHRVKANYETPHIWWRKAYLPPQSQSCWVCWTLSRPGGSIVELKRNRTQHDTMQPILFVTVGHHISAWIDPGITTVTVIAPALGTEWTVTRWTSLVTGPWIVYSENSTGLTKRWQYWVLLYTYMITTWSTTVCCKHVSHFNHATWQLLWSVCVCRQRGRALTPKVHNPLKSPVYTSHGGVKSCPQTQLQKID